MVIKLLERETPLHDLEAALKEAAAGEGRVALVSGEAGIGKTSLVEQFTRQQRNAGRVLWGACDALFTPRPLGPLHDIAAQLAGNWLTLLNSDANRTALFSAFLAELQSCSAIAVFEDVHWADEATLDLLKFLSRRIARTPTLLLMTYRDDEIGPRHTLRTLLGDLATSVVARRIALSPLSEGAVQTLIGDRSLDPTALHRQTGGNPFFVTEAIAAGSDGIPPTVRDAVLARAARLSPSGRAVLEAAAVVGPRIEPWLLAEVTGAEISAVEACMAVGVLVVQGDTMAFRHELARQTILEAISPQQKLVLHRLVLESLKSSPTTRADLARLAHHAEGAGDRAAVHEYAPAAARQAAALKAHREAADQYARALRFAHDLSLDEHALLLEAYARECNIIDRRPEGIAARRQALELWRSTGNALKQGENLALSMVMYFGIGQTAEAERVSRSAIDVLESLPLSRELALAYRMRATLCMFNRDITQAIAWGEKAIALAEHFKDYDTLAGAYNAIGSAQIVLDYEQGRASLERSLTIAQAAGLEVQVANAYNNLGSASGEVYRYHQADSYLTQGIAFCLERDLDVSRLYMQAWLALTHLHLGRWSEAADAATIVLHHQGVSAISRIMALLALGRLRARRGDPGVFQALDEALDLAEQTETLQRIAAVRAARAEAAWLIGDHARALTEAQAAYDLALSKQHPWFTGELGFWQWRAGADVVLPTWTAEPFARHVAGDWHAAAETWQALGCPYEQALALADGDEAAQQTALAIFQRLGAVPAIEILSQKLPATPARQPDKKKFGGITRRERQVVALIAQGKSNRDIAVALVLSLKTVETYVTRILNKLGFDSRVQIATWAMEKGIGPPPADPSDE